MLNKYSWLQDANNFTAIINQMIEVGVEFGEDTYSTIIRSYLKWNKTELALDYYRKMKASCIKPSITTYHCMIDIFIKMNDEKSVVESFKSLVSNGIIPNYHLLLSLVKFYIDIGKVHEAREIQDLFRKFFPHIPNSMRCHNMIMNHYAYFDNHDGMMKELRRATAIYNVQPDLTSYEILVKALAPHDMKRASDILDRALAKYSDCLTADIFVAMMSAYCDKGDFESAKRIYTKMTALEVEPDQKTLKLLSFIGGESS